MPRPPTGQSAGRPTTQTYASLLARVHQELAEQVNTYAELHDTSIPVLIQEGWAWRLQTDLSQREDAGNAYGRCDDRGIHHGE